MDDKILWIKDDQDTMTASLLDRVAWVWRAAFSDKRRFRFLVSELFDGYVENAPNAATIAYEEGFRTMSAARDAAAYVLCTGMARELK